MYVGIFIGNGAIKMHEKELKKQINAKVLKRARNVWEGDLGFDVFLQPNC